jgi:hypothetical protein
MLKTFEELAIDVSTVIAVSKNVCSTQDGLLDRSAVILSPRKGREVVMQISAFAAEQLIEHLRTQKTQGSEPSACPSATAAGDLAPPW